MTSAVPSVPLATRLLPIRQPLLRALVQLALGVALLALLAQVRLDIGPVPVTGQTFGVLFIGASYGTLLGGATLASYLALGGLGLPIFQGGASGLFGATAGYLFGFFLAALVVGYLAERDWDKRAYLSALALLAGNLVIYIPGLVWLRTFAPDWPTTLEWGFFPFILGDLLKLGLAAILLPAVWRLLGRQA